MLGGKTWDEWITQYAKSHQNPINRFCHTVGIPLIVLSLPLLIASFWVEGLWVGRA